MHDDQPAHEKTLRFLQEAVHSALNLLGSGWFTRRRWRRAQRLSVVNLVLAESQAETSETEVEQELTRRVDALASRWGEGTQDDSMRRVFREVASSFMWGVVTYLLIPSPSTAGSFDWTQVDRLAEAIDTGDVARAIAREASSRLSNG